MGTLVQKGRGTSEEEKFRQYVKQLKEECAGRLMHMLYNPQYGTMDLKFWLAFSKRKFLKMSMWYNCIYKKLQHSDVNIMKLNMFIF